MWPIENVYCRGFWLDVVLSVFLTVTDPVICIVGMLLQICQGGHSHFLGRLGGKLKQLVKQAILLWLVKALCQDYCRFQMEAQGFPI